MTSHDLPPGTSREAASRPSVHAVLWLMIAVMAGFELMFWLAGQGLLPPAFDRWEVFLRLAFFDVLFDRAVAGEGIEPRLVWSLVTYAFLHGNILHLAFNGAAFLGLGNMLVRAIGATRFVVLFLVTAVGGAVTFGLLADTQGPMVGASGALFGMLAIITAWQERALRRTGRSREVIWKRIGGLVLLNVLLALGLGGLLAWQAHLGGWVAGWLMAGLFTPRTGPLRML